MAMQYTPIQYDSSAIPNATAKPAQGVEDFLANNQREQFNQKQNTISSDFLTRYREAINQQTPLAALYQRLSGEMGLPELQKASTGLNQSMIDLQQVLSSLPERVGGETRGFNVNNAQLARIKEARSIPLQRNLTDIGYAASGVGQQLSSAQQALNQRLGYEQADQARLLLPFDMEKGLMSEQLAREATGFNQDNQQQYEFLISKYQTGVALDAAEKSRLNALQIQKNQFDQEKKIQDEKFAQESQVFDKNAAFQTSQPTTQVIEANGRQLLVDSKTGAIIKDLGYSTTAKASQPSELQNKLLSLIQSRIEGSGTTTSQTQPTETKPSYTPKITGTKSPNGQWYYDGTKNDWVPVNNPSTQNQSNDYSAILNDIFK